MKILLKILKFNAYSSKEEEERDGVVVGPPQDLYTYLQKSTNKRMFIPYAERTARDRKSPRSAAFEAPEAEQPLRSPAL
jgi:hypothetical protein